MTESATEAVLFMDIDFDLTLKTLKKIYSSSRVTDYDCVHSSRSFFRVYFLYLRYANNTEGCR